MKVEVEISKCARAKNRICVRFDYADRLVNAVRSIPGANYVRTAPKHWHVPLDMDTCKDLRKAFKKELVIGPALRQWAKDFSLQSAKLGSYALDSKPVYLERLPHVLPNLYASMHVGPVGLMMKESEFDEALHNGPPSFQCADIAFLAAASAPLNGNQPGLGKTPETIASIWEAGREAGDHLVIAPSSAVDGTWEPELEQWHAEQLDNVGIFACTGTRAEREETLRQWGVSTKPVNFVVVNPQMIQYQKDKSRTSPLCLAVKGPKKEMLACLCGQLRGPHEHYVTPYPELLATTWRHIINDECQKGNVRNHKTLTAAAIHALRTQKNIGLSGTPMKKKGGSDLWGILNWLRPDVFTSYWRFVGNYFDVDDGYFGKTVGDLRADREGAFWEMLTPYMLRRTKDECLPWLPPKMYIEVPCDMSPKQRKQYKQMEEEGVARVSGEEVGVTSILAELTRLRQFSFGYWVQDEDNFEPTDDSGKLEAMLEKMEEHGMFDDLSKEKQIVFSNSRKVIELVAGVLRKRGLKTDIVSGKQNKKGQRRQIKEDFQNGDTRVLCVVTTAGGVSLTLDAADVVHMLDQSFAPDEDEQAEDRAHRASRVHQVVVYQYRTRDSIDFYVQNINEEKKSGHQRILDVRREMLAQTRRK